LIIELNPAQENLTGYMREDILGKAVWDIQFELMPESQKSPGFYERMKQQSQSILASGEFANFNHPTEGVIRSKSGEIRHILQTSFPIQTDSGTYRIGSIMRDISNQKQAELDRENLITELKAKNTELEQFTYTVSHDLKAPIITIKGFLGLLEKDALEGNIERVKKDIQRITEGTERMNRLLNELLDLSRIGRIVNPSQEVPFNAIVQDAIAMVQGRLNAGNVKIKLENGLPVVSVDRVRMVQVVQNLLDNSAKFMGGQPEPLIEIGTEGKDINGNIIFFVKDNGSGIAAEQLERAFGLFQKLDTDADGTGIGLALVKRIIEVHGGRTWITSQGIGHGTTVYFTLPAP
jgi:PAS domain S-box-containing protein